MTTTFHKPALVICLHVPQTCPLKNFFVKIYTGVQADIGIRNLCFTPTSAGTVYIVFPYPQWEPKFNVNLSTLCLITIFYRHLFPCRTTSCLLCRTRVSLATASFTSRSSCSLSRNQLIHHKTRYSLIILRRAKTIYHLWVFERVSFPWCHHTRTCTITSGERAPLFSQTLVYIIRHSKMCCI
jgi:hypothetical protein